MYLVFEKESLDLRHCTLRYMSIIHTCFIPFQAFLKTMAATKVSSQTLRSIVMEKIKCDTLIDSRSPVRPRKTTLEMMSEGDKTRVRQIVRNSVEIAAIYSPIFAEMCGNNENLLVITILTTYRIAQKSQHFFRQINRSQLLKT